VNRFVTDPVAFEVFGIDPKAERDQITSLERVRATRDATAVRAGLESVRLSAEVGENVVPACVEAVSAYATVGEIADVLRAVHGVWTPSTSF
jgi:methylmalonyl-CoA mutase N-terminal domain/subunit